VFRDQELALAIGEVIETGQCYPNRWSVSSDCLSKGWPSARIWCEHNLDSVSRVVKGES
jgi:hypothetical protein